ncbi:MAG: hypothetical protein WBM50_21585 [Acidimicrobiales bacterium]
MADQFFPYDCDNRWAMLFRVIGLRRSEGVTVYEDGSLVATFGRKRVDTTIDNVDHTEITGPHRWYTAVGIRLSFTDDGLTFGTNHRRGLCIAFVERIPRVIGFRDHSALWVSVADPEGLARALDH